MLAASENAEALMGVAVYGVLIVMLTRFFLLKARHRRHLRGAAITSVAANVVPIHPTIATPPTTRFNLDAPPEKNQPIEFVRQLVGPIPRKFNREIEVYLSIRRPSWMASNDPMGLVFRRQKKIRRDGVIVWAVFVQANQMNFKPGPTDVGGSMIFSLDPHYDGNPGELQNMAAELYMLKGTDQADADAGTFARMLTIETSRGMGLAVPKRFTGGRKVLHSSMIFPRKHLPNGFVSANILPVWLDTAGGHGLLPVPAAFWPASLLAFWSRTPPANSPTPAQPKQAEE